MTARSSFGAFAASAMFLFGGMATAQDSDLQVQGEELQQRYEEAIAAGDWDAVSSLYTEDAIYAPVVGGMFEGREEIRGYYEQSGLKSVDVSSSRMERIGEDLVLDLGTFTATVSAGEEEADVQGEYVALAEVGENGLQIRSLTSFPMRQPSAAPSQ